MNDETDEWMGHMMKKASLKTTTTSFTICNNLGRQEMWKWWKIKYADQSVNGTIKSANSITDREMDYAP
jgi:hypothetical protein